ncbi:MAG: DNA/RNA nuclease SfsA [Candidatus Obscuribacterales bacterium]
MILSNLVQAKLVKRYKRFLADVEFKDGTVVTAHCPNPGSMLGMCDAGMNAYLSHSADPKRKLPWTLKLVECPSSLVVVDTMLANKLFKEAFELGRLTEFSRFDQILSEQVFSDSRFDFLLSHSSSGTKSCYVEVKSATMWQDGRALFPDARTERGRKHLATLSKAVADGFDACQFYLVGRSDAQSFGTADDIDPLYGQALRLAKQQGVTVAVRALEFNYLNLEKEKIAAGLPFDMALSVGGVVDAVFSDDPPIC